MKVSSSIVAKCRLLRWSSLITTCRYTHSTCNNRPGQPTHRINRYYLHLSQVGLSSPRRLIFATPYPYTHTHTRRPQPLPIASPRAYPDPAQRGAGTQAGGGGRGARSRPSQRPRPRPLCAIRLTQLRFHRRYCHRLHPFHRPLVAAAGSAPPSALPCRTRRCHHPARGPGNRP